MSTTTKTAANSTEIQHKKKGTPEGAPVHTTNGTTKVSRNQWLAEILFDMIGKYDKPIKRPKNPAIDRAFRRLIQEANMSGDCIINLGEGYFRPGKDDYVDLAEYLLKEQARAKEIMSKCVSMRQAYNRRYL